MNSGFSNSYSAMLLKRGVVLSGVYKKLLETLDYYIDILASPIIPMKYFETSFRSFNNVVLVETTTSKKSHDVRVYVDGDDWASEEKIYQKYSEMLDELPEVDFEVHVIELHGRDPNEVKYQR